MQGFTRLPEHRVVYLVGNHDAEVWWNTRLQRSLIEAGLVNVFALSYSTSFQSLPDELIYCEHGNQFDPSNTLVDYANPLDTPAGAHVVTELVRPIGPGAAITTTLDLRDVSYVFPLAAIPEWIAGRIFYQFLGRVLRWLLGYGLVALIGVAAWVQRNVRIRQFAEADRDLPLSLATGHRYRGVLAIAVSLFGLLGWLLYDPLGLKNFPLAVALSGLVGVVLIIASSVPMWNQILRYARGEPVGIERSGQASRTKRP
jgi:hypothetical protein